MTKRSGALSTLVCVSSVTTSRAVSLPTRIALNPDQVLAGADDPEGALRQLQGRREGQQVCDEPRTDCHRLIGATFRAYRVKGHRKGVDVDGRPFQRPSGLPTITIIIVCRHELQVQRAYGSGWSSWRKT